MVVERMNYANEIISKEIDEILMVDETIKQQMDVRDRKVSPVITMTK
jgi:hypothetical protein